MSDLDLADVKDRLDLSERALDWLQGFEELPPGMSPMALPSDDVAAGLLLRLGVDDEDRVLTLENRPDPLAHKELWWILERAYGDLIAKMGTGEPGGDYHGWPTLPESLGVMGRFAQVWVLLAAVPTVSAYGDEREIPEEILWTSLSSISEDLRVARRMHGRPGLHGIWSSPMIFRASMFSLGRLAFNFKAVPGGTISVHIPGRRTGGPMNPEACDAAIAQAREFFPRHFPDLPYENFSCTSWLLDEQLADYLPADSNMLKFQRRFDIQPSDGTGEGRIADREILQFIHERTCEGPDVPEEILADLPRETTLQRAYVSHLRAGKHFYWVTGTFAT